MTERRTSWLCPACGRQVPVYVDGCRCGVARALALPGVEIAPRAHAGPGAPARMAAALVGYSPGVGWSGGRRIAAAVVFVATLGLTFAVVYAASSGEAAVAGGEARILARLDEHTTGQSASVKDTIPTFLLRPGLLGTLTAPEPQPSAAVPAPVSTSPPSTPPAGTSEVPTDLVPLSAITALSDGELRKGFCTPTLTGLIRQRFPGSYDGMADAELQKRVLAKYPEYRGRICDLPAWIGAGPHEIVKYEAVNDRPASVPTLPPWVMAGLATFVLAFISLNLYYRLIAPRLTTES